MEIKPIRVDDLIYDVSNPRLPKSVDGSNEREVITWMLENENLVELMLSIAERGYFAAEPIWVIESEAKEGKFEVVEGNRRLTAVKLLRDPDLASIKKTTIAAIRAEAKVDFPDELPAIVFPNREAVELYLGYRHVTGVEEWDALAKARYLKKMEGYLGEGDEAEKYRSLAKLIGSKAAYVKKILTGLEVYTKIEENRFFGISGLNETTMQFGVLYTALDSPSISRFLGIDGDSGNTDLVDQEHLRELTSWMFEKHSEGTTRLGESRNIKHLAKILDSEVALKSFRQGTALKDAVLLTSEAKDVYLETMIKVEGLMKLALGNIYLINKPTQVDVQKAIDIQNLARTLVAAIQTRQDPAA